jgi:cyanophycinase
VVIGLLMIFAPGALVPAAENPAKRGKLVIAGGAVVASFDAMWDVMLKERLPNKAIGVISLAGANPEEDGPPLVERLNAVHGRGTAVFLPLGRDPLKAADAATLAALKRCGGFFFTGGHQERIARALIRPDGGRTPALEAIWEIHEQGGVIGGTSAGAAMMSDPMISGGTSPNSLVYGATPSGIVEEERGVCYARGMGFHRGVLYCQHHLERGRFPRLVAALMSEPLDFPLGIGVCEDTAWVFDHASQTGRVIGSRGVVVVDASHKITLAGGGFGGILVHHLERGDSMHLPSRKIHVAAAKKAMPHAAEPGLKKRTFAVDDAWGKNAIRKLMFELARSLDVSFATALDPNVELKFRRGEETRVWRDENIADDGKAGWTFSHLILDLRPRPQAKATALLKPATTISATGPIAVGKERFTLSTRGKTLPVFTYRPATYQNGPLVIVMHGMNRNAETYRDNAVPLGDRFKGLVVVPEFSQEQFPDDDYQKGGVTRKGGPRAERNWSFTFIDDLVAAVRQREGKPELPYYLIGHSAGGQFLNRLAAFHPGGAQRIIAANPGSLIFPTRDWSFHYGFGNLPLHWSDDAWLKRYLAAPLTLYLGTEDILPKNLDVSPEAMRQGATRIERGRACYAMAAALAKEKGWPFHWTLVEAPGVGHNSAAMFSHPQAEKAIFGEKGKPR